MKRVTRTQGGDVDLKNKIGTLFQIVLLRLVKLLKTNDNPPCKEGVNGVNRLATKGEKYY